MKSAGLTQYDFQGIFSYFSFRTFLFGVSILFVIPPDSRLGSSRASLPCLSDFPVKSSGNIFSNEVSIPLPAYSFSLTAICQCFLIVSSA